MNATEIAERFAGHPFVDAFDCLIASIAAAKSRSKLAVRAAKMGDLDTAIRHRKKRDEYLRDVRDFHARIDWSDE
jgi:hypothetical protein